LIGQFNYTTTLRYNFPKEDYILGIDETQLPKRFIELSLASLRSIEGRLLHVESRDIIAPFYRDGSEKEFLRLDAGPTITECIQIQPLSDNTPIVAIDVSSIKLGETDTGVLCAVRGAIVWSIRRRYRYLKVGPFPFHITEENLSDVLGLLRLFKFATSGGCRLEDVQTRLGILIEKWLQMSVCSISYDNVVLWDGSLTAGPPDNPHAVLSNILSEARRNKNKVLAISKVTTIRFSGRKMTEAVSKYRPPCILRVNGLRKYRTSPVRLLGDVYVAKLSDDFSAFRIDIDCGLRKEEGVTAVKKVLGNDIVFQGYPETLRLAHILSTFTASEVIGIQRYLAHKYNLKVIIRPSVRRILFGPYGTRFES